MPIKRKSGKSSKPSNAARKRTGQKHTALGRQIIAGLNEALAFSRGEISLPVRSVNVPPQVDVRKIRARSGLSQAEFAARYGFNPRTLQDWEQGRVRPDGAVRAYLTVIERRPQAVQAALSRRPARVGAA